MLSPAGWELDEVNKYNVGDVLPVFIFYKDDKEFKRTVGEKTEEELMSIIEEMME